ncbi:hypothetical protein AAV94_06695 [Lampropedia cohaerens]|uniref:DUF3619 family protein n=2 Tax=Lampropedia cohaerens TaxID=1610491 RepID=A0A0U1Q057_9BURK|nr:hypothetical protein AAV94_06695 [Lampropedia cohaerens]
MTTMRHTQSTHTLHQNDALPAQQALDAQGAAIGKLLRRGEAALAPDVAARLRFARQQALQAHALASARVAHQQPVPSQPRRPLGWWKKTLAAVPFLAAGAGAVFMQGAVSDDGMQAGAAIDLKILQAPVPPSAFADPAFMAYLEAQSIHLPGGGDAATP